jgi:RNA exonuclease 4
MVGIGQGGCRSSVARVTAIDWYGNVLLDEYIQQTEEVTDYRTEVSGITKENLQDATMTIEEGREILVQMLYNRILVGHDLRNDLTALRITHPWWLTRDTAKYPPFMQTSVYDGLLLPRKLRTLASEILHKQIQMPGNPHSPYEDALAALDLYRSVREDWEIEMAYKVGETCRMFSAIETERFDQELDSFFVQSYR